MRILDSLWKTAKLGLFVSWGARAALLSACSGRGTPQPVDLPTQRDTARPPDAAVRADAGAPDQQVKRDRRGWDMPLE